MKPFVSVVIPGYKKEYIRETIDSVLQQTYKSYEIVVVDDGSPNHLKELLKDYIDKGLIRYIYQENKKMAGAKNTGIRHAQGELIAFLDDDDLWHPTKLEKQVCMFEDPQVGICYTWAMSFQSDHPEKKVDMSINSRKIVRPEFEQFLLAELSFPSSSVMVRKESLEKVGCFNESPEYYSVDDSDLWIRICRHYKAAGVKENLMFYRLHNQQFSANTIPLHNRAIAMRNKLINEFKLGKEFSDYQMAKTYQFMGYDVAVQNRKLEALGYYCKSLFYKRKFSTVLQIIKLFIPNWLKLLIRNMLKK